MLPEERLEAIVRIVGERSSVTTQELTELLDASESTIRRDITALAVKGRIVKVHGGAMATAGAYGIYDSEMSERRELNREAKQRIGVYAAALIKPGDTVYIDAGTTTEYFIDAVSERTAVYVTNGMPHAKKLAEKGFSVHMIGGMVKPVTEAVIGEEAVSRLGDLHFSVGFFGANGVHHTSGITTPDICEAAVKRRAVHSCNRRYVLCDSSKFGRICAANFAGLDEVVLITERAEEKYRQYNLEVIE